MSMRNMFLSNCDRAGFPNFSHVFVPSSFCVCAQRWPWEQVLKPLTLGRRVPAAASENHVHCNELGFPWLLPANVGMHRYAEVSPGRCFWSENTWDKGLFGSSLGKEVSQGSRSGSENLKQKRRDTNTRMCDGGLQDSLAKLSIELLCGLRLSYLIVLPSSLSPSSGQPGLTLMVLRLSWLPLPLLL